jgi:hypothetical protein
MYSPFNLSSRRSFAEQELAREHLSFPNEIDEAYSAVIDWLSGLEGMAGFDRTRNIDLDSNDMPNAGRQFSILLPAHTMKVYQTLLYLEHDPANEQTISILEQPHISIIDDGCGGGTASVALISLVVNYQKYKTTNKLPIFPITIACLGIDPNENALQIYGTFLCECAAKVKHLLIAVQPIVIYSQRALIEHLV